MMNRLACVLTVLAAASPAYAQSSDQPEDESKKKEPKKGDFDAGAQARFPSGPDEDNNFASFNWVAADVKARYFLLNTVTANFNMPLAVIHPDTIDTGMGAESPKMFGGGTLNIDARLPIKKGSVPFASIDTDIGVVLTAGYMREGAMLLSEKDYPKFVGTMQPGIAAGVVVKLKVSSAVDFSLLPTWVRQSGEMESREGVQVPLALTLGIGDLVKVSAEAGVYTADDYSLRGSNGGRIATGAALDLRLGHILLHAGAGVASLLTGPVYPTISDSVYVDLNVKYAK